jgi:hypothetical protein
VETWHYVAIGAVVVIGGVWYVRRRNRAKVAAVRVSAPRYASFGDDSGRAAAAAAWAARDVSKPINYDAALSVAPDVKAPGMGAGGAVALSRSLY